IPGSDADDEAGRLAEGIALLDQLAELVRPQSNARARALQTVAAALTRASGDTEGYVSRLSALHADDAADLVVVRALAKQRRESSDVLGACAVLEAAARALGDADAELAASLWL